MVSKLTKKKNCCRHLHKELFSAIETVVKRDDWIFAQDGAQSHQSHSVQDFAEECSILT